MNLYLGQYVLVPCPVGSVSHRVGKIIKFGTTYFSFPESLRIEVYIKELDSSFIYRKGHVVEIPEPFQKLFW